MGRSSATRYRKQMAVNMAIVLVVMIGILEVGSARMLKDNTKAEPQNYYGSFGGTGGLIPTPTGPVLGFGPSTFCSVPGTGCVTVPGNGALGGAGVGSVQPGGGGGAVGGAGGGSVPPGGGGGTVGSGVGSPP